MTDRSRRARLGLREVFGWTPCRRVLADLLYAARGRRTNPPTRFGPSSLSILKPRLSLATWLRRRRADRRVPVYNLFNRVAAPKEAGYSVRVTFARDFRGGRYTYDSHLGTDFAVPIGTPVVAAAPGVVLRIANDYDRGGLKVCIDHGAGLLTTSNHLARALVAVGDQVGRGEVVGLSGASGIEFLLMFPWLAPHLHFNTWLNGEPTDPYGLPDGGDVALWLGGNDPTPHAGAAGDRAGFEATAWDAAAVDAAIAACGDPRYRARMERIDDLPRRAAEVIVQRNYRSIAFAEFPPLYARRFARQPVLDLPFSGDDFIGAALPEPD